ncbi:integrating conjugative element protein [Xenorhabdus bovienii]|nr:integrating conjugative element protein [Xenorhabdus bovienii]MDE9477985.1 integrating conjugative element protein [Xenorhabdus bovienii]MDE9528793.1 integrating conjugative element protein [Xenorhabdus bovienii]
MSKQNILQHRLTMSALLSMLLLSGSVYAWEDNNIGYGKNTSGAVSDKLFYTIGGGTVLSQPPSRSNLQRIGMSMGWNNDLMCGNFDLKTTISNQLNGVTDGFKNLMGDVIQGATGAVASLPALVIQRANPGLYEMLTNGVLQANVSFDKAQLNCQNLSKRMMDFSDSNKWTQAAVMEESKNLVNTGSGDAVKVNQKLDGATGEKGVPWIGGVKRGGRGQPAIKPTYDLAKAGFNIMNSLPVTSDQMVSVNQCTGAACQRFKNSEEAAKTVVSVLGDQSIRTCKDTSQCTDGTAENQPGSSVAGTGFAPVLEKTAKENQNQLIKLVNGQLSPTSENLSKLKTGNLIVTRGVIQSLKRDPDNSALVQRLAGELAMSDTVEMALTMRRMLMTGQSEPNAANQTQAMEVGDRRIGMLDREINALKNEMELRREISNNTVLTIIERDHQRTMSNPQMQSHDNTDKRVQSLNNPPKGGNNK